MHPSHFPREINVAISQIEWSPTNDQAAILAHELYIVKSLENIVAAYKKRADKLKNVFAHKLSKPCEQFELIVTTDVTVSAKVSNPRSSLDIAAFINAVADTYDLSAFELFKLAEAHQKQSAAPVSFSVTAKDAPRE